MSDTIPLAWFDNYDVKWYKFTVENGNTRSHLAITAEKYCELHHCDMAAYEQLPQLPDATKKVITNLPKGLPPGVPSAYCSVL